MFCEKCGNKLREGAVFCNKCGVRVMGVPKTYTEEEPVKNSEKAEAVSKSAVYVQNISQSASAQNRAQTVVSQPNIQQPQRQYYPPGTHPYHRLGGFLMWMVVGNYIAGVSAFIDSAVIGFAYFGLMGFSKWYAPGFIACLSFTMIGAIILMIISGCVEISFANKIRRKDADVLGFMQSASLTMMISCIVFVVIVYFWLSTFDRYGTLQVSSYFGQLIGIGFVWLIGLIIGSVYFGTSVRVRTYMGSDTYLKRSVFNKHSVSPIPADGSDQPSVVNPNDVVSFNPEKQWYCTQCNRINENYTTTCRCGMRKPSSDLSKSWICKYCGNYNMGNLHECSKCGKMKYQEHGGADWICPKCGGRNGHSNRTCSICYTPNPNKSEHQAQRFAGSNEWQCPTCGKINANYVGTCGCGQTKP